MNIKPWIEAMRLRTLPVSIAGVLGGTAVAFSYDQFDWVPALICLIFAIVAQIVSNFVNEYFDFKNGIDKRGRQGFRRGVTEGDIRPETMKKAILWLTAADCLLGLTLIYWGGYWMIAIGILIIACAFAYSAGPWPLSHHGLGDEAVIIFYGIIPVTLTSYLQCEDWIGGALSLQYGQMWGTALLLGLGIGLLGANVLNVNNIRDARDDAKVGKRTKAVIFGVKTMRYVYITFTYIGLGLMWYAMKDALPEWGWAGYAAIAIWYSPVIVALFKFSDYRLNQVLRYTAMLLLVAVSWTVIACIIANPEYLSHSNLAYLRYHNSL